MEAGILNIGYVDSLRSSIADRRTEGFIDAIPEFEHTKRGVIAPMAEINRSYPHILEHDMPDLIDSAVAATRDKERSFLRYSPTLVFTCGVGANQEDDLRKRKTYTIRSREQYPEVAKATGQNRSDR